MREIKTLRTDIKDLQNRIYEIQKRQAEVEVKIQDLQDRRGAAPALSPTTAGGGVTRSEGEPFAEPAVPGSTIDAGFTGPTRDEGPSSSGSGETWPGSAPGAPPPSSSASPSGTPVEGPADRLYVEGYSRFNTGNYAGAQEAFQEFLTRSPGSDLADDAQYWIGECFFSQKDYRRAILEFRKVIDQYPFGNKVPNSFLKIGLAYLALGERERAAENLETVVEAFPKSDVATVARATLDEIQKR